MTSDRHLDPVAFQPRGWLIAGGTETLVGLFVIGIVLTAALGGHGNATVHSALLYLSGLLVVAGFITIAATAVAMASARGHEATIRHVGPSGHLSKQLLAARTVDLIEVRDQIEGTARNLTVNAIEDLKKSSGAQYQALSDQMAQLGARVDRMTAVDGLDPVYLADMAKSVQLGREMERNRQDPNTI